MSLPNKPPRHNTPHWRALLHRRGISDQVIDHCQIRPSGRGWLYPFAPGADVRRWKAYPGQRGPKYLWRPQKPDTLTFYDPRGELEQQIASAGGVLYLAAGEPDVWALMTTGVFNVTCTMASEVTIPDWLIPELQRLGVKTVIYFPDLDRAGDRAAAKLAAALANSGITLEIYSLPESLGEKGDINTLLIAVGADELLLTLQTCQPYEPPIIEDDPPAESAHRRDPATIPDNYKSLYDRWCSEVEQAAVAAWNIAPANGEGWSRRNFSSPHREDRNPSACWSYSAHGFQDYATGEFTNTHQVAALIGFQAWEDFKAQHAPPPTLPPPVAQKPEPKPRDYSARTLRWHWTAQLRELLLNLHAETDSRKAPKWPDFPDFAPAVMLLELVITAENTGQIALGATLAERDLMQLAAPRGLTRHTVRKGIDLLEQTGIFCRKSPREKNYEVPYGDFQQKIGTGRGKRGPSVFWVLNDPDIALDNLVATLRANAMRTAVFAPDGERILIPDHPRENGPYRLSPAEIDQAEQRRAPLYDRHAEERAKAEQAIDRRARVLRQRLKDAAQHANAPAELIPPEVQTPNKLQYRAALDRQHFEDAGGVRCEPDTVTMQRLGCKHHEQLRRIREINGVATVARHKKHQLHADQSVFDQVPDYTMQRGWGLKLESSTGDTFEVTHKTQQFADRWVQRQIALGATVCALERIASFERPATVQEKRIIAARQQRRKDRAREYRQEIKNRDREPTHRPQVPETPPHEHSEFYARQQARFGLAEFTPYRLEGDTLISTITGKRWKAPSAAQLWRAWAGTLEHEKGEAMPTFTAHSEPTDGIDVTAEFEGLRRAKPKAGVPNETPERSSRARISRKHHHAETRNFDAINAAARVTPADAAENTCSCCGKPADVLTFTGWQCAECYSGAATG